MALSPETNAYGKSVTRAQYSGIVQGIKAYLDGMEHEPKYETFFTTSVKDQRPSVEDIRTALGVLDYFLHDPTKTGFSIRTPLGGVLSELKSQLEPRKQAESASSDFDKAGRQFRKQKKCYICQYVLNVAHPQYPSVRTLYFLDPNTLLGTQASKTLFEIKDS